MTRPDIHAAAVSVAALPADDEERGLGCIPHGLIGGVRPVAVSLGHVASPEAPVGRATGFLS